MLTTHGYIFIYFFAINITQTHALICIIQYKGVACLVGETGGSCLILMMILYHTLRLYVYNM